MKLAIHPLDLCIIILYLAGIVGSASGRERGARAGENNYFLAGRPSHGPSSASRSFRRTSPPSTS